MSSCRSSCWSSCWSSCCRRFPQAGDPQTDEVADERLVEIDRGAQAAVRVGADRGVAGKLAQNGPIKGDVVGAAGEAGTEENRV